MGFQLRGFDEREGATWQPGKTLRCFVLSSSPSLLLLLLTLLLMLLLLPSLLVPIRSAVLAAEEARPTWISNKPAVSVIDEGNAAAGLLLLDAARLPLSPPFTARDSMAASSAGTTAMEEGIDEAAEDSIGRSCSGADAARRGQTELRRRRSSGCEGCEGSESAVSSELRIGLAGAGVAHTDAA